jgi:cell division protein FtsQ
VAADRRWAPLAVVGAVTVLTVAAAAAGLTYTPIFRAKTIEVAGSSRPDAEVIAAAGLSGRTNVFHLDERVPESALLDDPWIARADVRRDLPSTIVITIRERRPVVTIDGLAIAADGTVLPGGPVDGLPVLRSTVGAPSEEAIVVAAALSSALGRLRDDVDHLVVAADGSFRLVMDDGLSVRWGRAGLDAEKAAALAALLEAAAGRGTPMITADVSVPAAPSARFA